MKVLVLGAGVVGATTAYWLARDGHEVVVVDRRDGVGLETSFANGGQISASHAVPWAGPETPGRVLKWIGRRDAPLLFHFRLDSAMWRWCVRFLRECSPNRMRRNMERTLRIADYSRQTLAALRAELNLEYKARTDGILHFFHDPAALDGACDHATAMRAQGIAIEEMTPDDIVAREPAFAATADTLAGGLFSPDDESGDAHTFTEAIADLATALGARFETATTVQRIEANGTDITGVHTDRGTFTADKYIVSLGSYSPLLLRPLGLHLPIYPAKGYSVTLPNVDADRTPAVSLTEEEHKLVYSRLGDTLRVAGTAELAGYDTTVNETRARFILDRALKNFPGCASRKDATFWAGLRPKTPDSVPIIGSTPYTNLLLNTGHGTLGWTMAAGSGRVLADLVAGRKADIDLDGLDMGRF